MGIEVIEHILLCSYLSPTPKKRAIADLIVIAFFFLLRVGEYTHTAANNRRTQQFRLCDIVFRRAHVIMAHHHSEATLSNADSASLHISDQKNGAKGQIVGQDATRQIVCPIKALARRVHNIVAHGGSPTTILGTYWGRGNTWRTIRPPDINATIKQAVVTLKLESRGITPDLVSSHSLRAGGAMALHLSGASADTIKKQGRWSGDTYQQYIHNQLSAFQTGLSSKMLKPHHSFHLGLPTTTRSI
ncbi:MAG: hypothetical protein AAF471_03640 [Myxococcota bacterium]